MTDLSGKLRQLGKLRASRDFLQAELASAEARYREAEQECVEGMATAGVGSMKVDASTYVAQTRHFSKITDLRAVLDWSADKHLWLTEHAKDLLLIPMEIGTRIDPKTKRKTSVLTNGILKTEVSKSRFNEVIAELLADGEPLPPGVESSSTTFITMRSTK